MRRLSLFSRLLIVFLGVMLICVIVVSVISFVNLRNSTVENRMDALKTQAREMAYLASRREYGPIVQTLERNTVTESYMRWKSQKIYEEYNAYIMLVDRYGKIYLYYSETTLNDKSIGSVPSKEEISVYMDQALQGEEVVKQRVSASGPLFTVLVPWGDTDAAGQMTVGGFVLIQTAAQTVHAAYQGLLWQIVLAALVIFLLAAAIVFVTARQMTRPLTAMAQAAGRMARGDFSAQAPEGGSREIRDLSLSFNRMGKQLSTLEQSRRDFVANVSHELRSPITSIQGFAQGMLDGTIPPEEHETYLRVVSEETHRLAKLINSLLNLSRMENEEISLAYTDFDICELARRVLISRMNQIDEKQLQIEADFPEEALTVRADADQIQQVLINLLDNAVKFTPEGGTITLSAEDRGGCVAFRVKDTGIGISDEDAPHVFDRFYKADKAHTVGNGTGLGLAICYRIMERHGQSIRLVGSKGGAEFEITLEKAGEEKRPGDGRRIRHAAPEPADGGKANG
ncbi:MAG: HAMP domain-containing histidine kinase [Clostridia bacterium]|nr:HAMP domain-containing histidine kinase [Clostridia bacterium]